MPGTPFALSGKLLDKLGRVTPLDLSPRHRLRLWRRGFRSWTFYTYELDKNDLGSYLPDSAMRAMQALNGEVGKSILRNKLLFASFFSGHFEQPPILGWVAGGRGFTAAGRAAPPREMLAWLEAYPDGLITKPFSGAEGAGVAHLERDGAGGRINGVPGNEADLLRHLTARSDHLITPFIRQASYASDVFPRATNTLRVITMQSEAVGAFIPVAVHRFGTEASVPTDNASRGGIFAPLDLATGELGVAVKPPQRSGERLRRYARHPDTGAAIAGLVVPRWLEVAAQLLEVVRRFPFLRYVGWDLVVTERGTVVLEGNSGASFLPQIFHPYLEDERITAFLRSVDVPVRPGRLHG